jgi:hypothetical protein
MRVIVDRIEGDFAVCEQDNLQMLDIPLKDIAFIPKEGDVLILDGADIKFDFEETKKRKKKIEEMTKGLWE